MADCSGYKAPKTATTGPDRRRVSPDDRVTPREPGSSAEALERLDAITRRLRVECPWDREQDERSIVPHTVEEAYELADAAHRGDDAKLLDELGDVLFQVYFLSLLLEERGAGSLAQVAEHVHREADPPPSARVRRDRGRDRGRGAAQLGPDQAGRGRTRAGSVRRGAREPALAAVRAQGPAPGRGDRLRLPRRGAGDRRRPGGARRAGGGRRRAPAPARPDREARFHELGDLLFAVVNIARKLRVDPELALRAASDRFRARVTTGSELAALEGRSWNDLRPDEQLAYYARARLAEGERDNR